MSDDEDTIGQLGYIDETGAVVIKPQFSVSTGGDFVFLQAWRRSRPEPANRDTLIRPEPWPSSLSSTSPRGFRRA